MTTTKTIAVIVAAFGAGLLVRASKFPVTGIYRVGYGIGMRAGGR